MTNREYITDIVDGLNLRDNDIDLILRRGKLDEDADADDKLCDIAIYRAVHLIIKRQSFDVAEGGYSKTWNDNAKMWYAAFCSSNGFRNVLSGKAKATFL